MSMSECFENAFELATYLFVLIITGALIVIAFAGILFIFLAIAVVAIPIAILMKLFEFVCSCICYIVDKTKSHN